MKHLSHRIKNMEKTAFILLKAGLAAVAGCSTALLYYILQAESLLFRMKLAECLPALLLSLIIVYGGAVAVDVLLKEQKQ